MLKENYRPVSILSKLSKIYEKLMNNQLFDDFDAILCGFQKGFNAQHCLLIMIEKFVAVLTDFSKVFACINHPLLIVRIYSYGVPPISTNMISFISKQSYTTNI